MRKKARNSRENTQAMKPNSTQRFWESSKKSDNSSKKKRHSKKILHNVFSSPVKKANTPVKKATQ